MPFSCAAWIHSIHRGIDVARAAGLTHVAAATGSTSEAAIKAMYDLPDMALLDMGDFVGGTLKYLRQNPVPWVTIAGGFGKLTKLAAGASRPAFESLAASMSASSPICWPGSTRRSNWSSAPARRGRPVRFWR